MQTAQSQHDFLQQKMEIDLISVESQQFHSGLEIKFLGGHNFKISQIFVFMTTFSKINVKTKKYLHTK